MKLSKFILLIIIIFSCKKEELQNPPSVLTSIPTDVQLKSATFNGEVTDDGYSTTTSKGFVYSKTNTSPTLNDSKILSGGGKGAFSFAITTLEVNTKYFYRAFATNSKGTSLGNVQSFTTADYKLPQTVISSPTNILYTSVQLTGSVTDEGGGSVSESGFVLSLNANPTISNEKFPVSNGKKSFSLVITKLKDNSKYYVKPYAINEKGVSYGTELTFTTKQLTLPTVSILKLISVSYFSSVLNFGFTDAGGSQITEYGICISENINPTVSDIVKSAGLAYSNILYSEPPTSAQFNFKNLKIGTTYHARAFAKNAKGIAYGTDFVFNTESRDQLIGQQLYGGVVAYVFKEGDPGYDPKVKHGIVTAPVSIYGKLTGVLEQGLENYSTLAIDDCYCTTDLSISTGIKIGDGKTNTNNIINTPCSLLPPPAYPYQSARNTASSVSNQIIINGYKDWFLPSLDELKEIYKNRDILIQMSGDLYFWTSSYCGRNQAYAIQFEDYPTKPDGIECLKVNINSSSGSGQYRFRPVRYF